ncbi:TrgA family protein [Roseovarius sp. SCSIO 43702]|uniref:TrgA family protein n=1 Tax=Roseovarius sp. SCSIO 43702 TaxID=2823043 RepID=UPI001C72FA8D|nr:TrgA family protein [Roseovarius sp. SCSIO 43702]QYX57954.1 TrgA family protein [Roseovarius sp. SCSIO 43702]
MRPSDKMPTAARLVAALCLAAIGWIGSDLIRPLMPPETNFGWFNYVNAGLGLVCGWWIIGNRLGTGYTDAISTGLTGVGGLVFWALFAQSFYLMIMQALDRKYKGPVEGIMGMIDNALDYGQYLLNWPLAILLVGGGIVTGLLAEWFHRRWS